MSQPEQDHKPAASTTIVWDLDGTLVESAPDLAHALNTLLIEEGRHTHHVDRVRTMIGHGVAPLIERGFAAAGEPLDPAELEALVPRFMSLYAACATRSTHLVPGAREILTRFYHAGVKQGLCTNKPEAITRQILVALDINGFFDSVVGGDTTEHKKPHPEPLLRCIEELDARPEDSVLIGDSAADVGSARAAGVAVILVPDGYTGAPAASLGADYVVEQLADVPACVRPLPTMKRTA